MEQEEKFAQIKKSPNWKKGNKVAVEFSEASTEINKQINKYNATKERLVKGAKAVSSSKQLKEYANLVSGLAKQRQGVERQIKAGLKKIK